MEITTCQLRRVTIDLLRLDSKCKEDIFKQTAFFFLGSVSTALSSMAEVSVSPIHASSSAPVEEVKEKLEVVAPTLPQAERVDKFLISRTKLSRSALQRLFEQNRVLVNGTVCKKSYKVRFYHYYRIVCSCWCGRGLTLSVR